MIANAADKLENVHLETVTVPHWVRGEEALYLVEPRSAQLAILGLGNSVGTGGKNLTGSVLIVNNKTELSQYAAQNMTQGKIIAFNEYCNWTAMPVACYGIAVDYRVNGANYAQAVGGIAALVRSVTPFSVYSPHTGMMSYNDNNTAIPTASITVEDAEMFRRMQDRGQPIVVSLFMSAQQLTPVPSGGLSFALLLLLVGLFVLVSVNVVAEWKGSTYPDEVVIVSGHLDSWDVGQGAM